MELKKYFKALLEIKMFRNLFVLNLTLTLLYHTYTGRGEGVGFGVEMFETAKNYSSFRP